jgi:putative addiction module antidote
MTMIRTLRKQGNSLGITIDKPILEILGLKEGDQLELTTDGKSLTIRPVETDHRKRVREAALRVTQRHHKTLKRLAES